MRKHRPVAARLHRGEELPFEGEPGMADRVDASIDAEEQAGVDAARDGPVAEATRAKLVEVDHTPLLRCSFGNANVHFST